MGVTYLLRRGCRMKLKMAVAGVSLMGGVGLALIGLTPVVANADPCGPPAGYGGPGPGGPHGQGGPLAGRPPGGQDLRGSDPGGPQRDFRRDQGPGDWRDPGRPGDWRGPGDWHDRDWGPRPDDAFRGWRDAPWGDGPAPWGWG